MFMGLQMRQIYAVYGATDEIDLRLLYAVFKAEKGMELFYLFFNTFKTMFYFLSS